MTAAQARPPLHLVSAFATTARLVLGQEAVPDKSSETAAIPALLERLGADGGLKGALVSIDAIATNATIAAAIRAPGADYLLAVKANQPTLRAEIERFFDDAPADRPRHRSRSRQGAWPHRAAHRHRFAAKPTGWPATGASPANCACPTPATIVRVTSRTEIKDRCRSDTRYFIASADVTAERAAKAVRGHWLHREQPALDPRRHLQRRPVAAAKGQRRPQHGHRQPLRHQPRQSLSDKHSIKLRHKKAGWNSHYLASIPRTHQNPLTWIRSPASRRATSRKA